MLAAADLCCERDERVLFSNLDLKVDAGQVLQIQGANGSGKTTLLRILCGLNADYSGAIRWRDQPQAGVMEDFRRHTFYLGHTPAINKTLTPRQNLRWFCALRGFSDEAALESALRQQGLAGFEDIPCYQLSAGQQRRVSLARMQLSGASLMILDEPFTALDRQGVHELEQRIAALAGGGSAIILTTHHALHLDCPLQVINLDRLTGVAR